MIDKPLQTPDDSDAPQPQMDAGQFEVPTTEDDSGGVTVDLDPDIPEEPEAARPEFSDNLADFMDEDALRRLGMDLKQLFDEDKASRADWESVLAKGWDFLGTKNEERSQPFKGASGVWHSLFSEAVVRFQSDQIMAIFPSEAGPVKTKIVGDITKDKEEQADRVSDYMNYVTTEVMRGYRPETEKLLFELAGAGSAFRKLYPNPIRSNRPDACYIKAEDFVVPYGATDLESAPRYTHIIKTPINDLRKLQVNGFYRDVDLGDPTPPVSNQLQEKKDDLTKETQIVSRQDYHELLEMHVDLDLEGFEDPDGIALPYVVTFERHTGEVLRVVRNWKEDDPDRAKVLHFAEYHFIPGLGFYGFGYIHLMGSVAKAATSILRQLIDSGTLANMQGGFTTARMKEQDPVRPGEWRRTDVPMGKLADSFFSIPYKEPSAVLLSLLDHVVEIGRRIGSMTDIDVGDMSSQAPVGTTLAILERNQKIMSAVQARMHNSLREEFKILARVISENLPDEYPYDVHGASRAIKKQDFDGRVDVFPVSNPNAATMAEKILKLQSATQLSQTAPPGLFDQAELYREYLHTLGIQNVEKIIPDKGDVPLMDPVSENQAVLSGKPVKAYQEQDHDAHLQAHKAFANDPQVAQTLGQNPQAQALFQALQAHIAEHLGYSYRMQMMQRLGVPLPPTGQPLPPDVESPLSMSIAQAAQRLLADHQQQQKMEQAQQQAQDPVLQLQQAEVQVKQAAVQQKAQESQQKAQLELVKSQQREQTERMRIASQHQLGLQNSQVSSQKQIQDLQLRQEELMMRAQEIAAQIAEAKARIDHMDDPKPPMGA